MPFYIFQLFLEVRDGGLPYNGEDPYLSGYGTLTVHVSRNLQRPYFQPDTYRLNVNEDDPVLKDIEPVTLIDPDLNVSSTIYFIQILVNFG